MRAARRRCSSRSPFHWMAPAPPPTPRFVDSMRFDKVCEGIRAAVAEGATVGLRVTLQRANYRELPRFVTLAHRTRREPRCLSWPWMSPTRTPSRAWMIFSQGLALAPADIAEFERLPRTIRAPPHAADFRSRFIAESPAAARAAARLLRCALRASERSRRCTAMRPNSQPSSVSTEACRPCFFIPGPAATRAPATLAALAGEPMIELVARDPRRRTRANASAASVRCIANPPSWRHCVCRGGRMPATGVTNAGHAPAGRARTGAVGAPGLADILGLGYRIAGAHRQKLRLEDVQGTPLLVLPTVFNPGC